MMITLGKLKLTYDKTEPILYCDYLSLSIFSIPNFYQSLEYFSKKHSF